MTKQQIADLLTRAVAAGNAERALRADLDGVRRDSRAAWEDAEAAIKAHIDELMADLPFAVDWDVSGVHFASREKLEARLAEARKAQ